MGEAELRAGGDLTRPPDSEPLSESERGEGSEESSSEQGNMLGENYERALDFRLQL